MTRPARSLETLAELEGAVATLLSTLEPVMEFVESGRPANSDITAERIWFEMREAKAHAAAKLADFENGTDV